MSFEQLTDIFNCGVSNRGLVRLDFDEAACLYKYVRLVPVGGKVVEIGRYHGGSTILIAQALLDTELDTNLLLPENLTVSSLLSIDKSPKNDDRLERMLHSRGLLGKVELAVSNSIEYPYSESGASFDLAFIDGDHSYQGAKSDHWNWGRRVKPGGFIVHHDMAKTRPNATQIPDIAKLRNDILQGQSSCVELVEEVGSISVFRRKGSCFKHF